MELVTTEIKQNLKPLYTYDGLNTKEMLNTKVIAKYFHCMSRYTFYVLEGDDTVFYGYCLSPLQPEYDEWGYLSIDELTTTKVYGVPMERDITVKPNKYTLGECLKRDGIKNTTLLNNHH